jgi:hypothetical protein
LEEEAADHFSYLSRNFQLFQTAQGINYSLMNLYQLLAQNRISPRRAAVLSHICGLLLRTLPQIDADKAAGIIDPTKRINARVADEDTNNDEVSDLDSGDDEESETESDAVTLTNTEVDPDPTNTWDASLPEPDPKKKPS